jgi:intracellular multiplication protein IcmG
MKMAELNQVITQLNAKLETQSQVIERLTVRTAPKPPKPRVLNGFLNQRLKYYVQAVIPGRAWLIATNGATLTVREGTLISGYGVVKLIDPTQGRVLTSSGRIIRFSQSDS